MNYIILRKSKDNIVEKVVQLLIDYPNPPDKKIHSLADKLGLEHSDLEAVIYGVLSDLIAHGKIDESKVDPEELKMGIDVEKEHTKYPAIAKFIALAHLKEINDYYTRLKKMEDSAKRSEA